MINHEIRKYLIDQCVKGRPITYEIVGQKLGLDLSLASERNILSKTLGEISAYEYQYDRPLISAIAIYKQTNDHGLGFYNLCEELGIGNSKTLSEQFFGMQEIENCKIFWSNFKNYKTYYNLDLEEDKILPNTLRLQSISGNGISKLPELNPSFEGVEVDFIQQSVENKELGNAGEELVKHHEINYLEKLGFNDLASQVEIVKDGKGYDIISFDKDRNKKYIEVKTTTDNSLAPFYYSINEKLFAEQNNNEYYIYRLYNYNEENNTADYYIINNINDNLLMQPIEFKVYLKKQK